MKVKQKKTITLLKILKIFQKRKKIKLFYNKNKEERNIYYAGKIKGNYK